MPVIRDVPLKLGMEEVLRREGIREYSGLRPELKKVLSELLAEVRKKHLLEPAIAYAIHHIAKLRHDHLYLENGVVLHGSLIPSILAGVQELATAVCTIGPRLEKKAAYYFGEKEPLRGLLLDGIGSAAVDSLAREVCNHIKHESSLRGYQASSPLSPGMPGLPITEQQQLFRLVPAKEIGVSLTEAGVMVPIKSVSMVIGIGSKMATWTQAEVCARCSLRTTCAHRVRA